MPIHERKPVKVTMTVEIEGHRLTFDHTVVAAGGRYDGEDYRAHGYEFRDTFEGNVREAFARASSNCSQDAARVLHRMYPVHGQEAGS